MEGKQSWEIFYISTIDLFIFKGRPTLLVFWLLFSGFATAMDIIYLIWNVTSSPVFDVHHFKHWTILYLGICRFTFYNILQNVALKHLHSL